MFGLFEKYSSTSEKKIGPITAKASTIRIFDIILKYVQDNECINISSNKEFCDIYCEQFGFEYTFQIVDDNSNSIINIYVYGEKKRGKTYRRCKAIKEYIIELLKENNVDII